MIGMDKAITDELKPDLHDVSKAFQWNPADAHFGAEIVSLEESPEQIKYFEANCHRLTDYAYWFFLSTCWVSYTGFTDLELWKRLFSSTRKKQKESIMKPSELRLYNYLPYYVTAYRAHRPNEEDWIAYTTNWKVALRFARERKVLQIAEYQIRKKDILAYFNRRGEDEIILLDKEKAMFGQDIVIRLV